MQLSSCLSYEQDWTKSSISVNLLSNFVNKSTSPFWMIVTLKTESNTKTQLSFDIGLFIIWSRLIYMKILKNKLTFKNKFLEPSEPRRKSRDRTSYRTWNYDFITAGLLCPRKHKGIVVLFRWHIHVSLICYCWFRT